MAPLSNSLISSRVRLLLVFLATFALAHARGTSPNAFSDPKDDIHNPLRYIPRNILTGISVGLWVACSTILIGLMWKYGGKYMWVDVVGGFTMAAGLALRFALHTHPDNRGIYIGSFLLIVLSPCAFIAGNYILISHLAEHLHAGQHLLVRPSRITKVFVASDVITFLVQAIGGAMVTSNTADTAKHGKSVILTGLALQLASFSFFVLTFLLFLSKVRRHEPTIWNSSKLQQRPSWFSDWRTLSAALAISCIGILVRSVYRIIEFKQGHLGKLSTTEGYFYGFDTLPLFIAIVIYVPFWPGRFIDTPARRGENVALDLEERRPRVDGGMKPVTY